MPANNFLPFCPTSTGTNLLTQGAYAAAADRTAGNQPGVASSKLNNKALRQSSFVVSQLAQLVATVTSTDMLDDGDTDKLFAQMSAALMRLPPVMSTFTSSSGTLDKLEAFFVTNADATIGATYTNNSVTFTILATVVAGNLIYARGNGSPTTSGLLTKTSGTGDSTIGFYAVRTPISINAILVGGGGGGSGDVSGAGGAGGDTTFGTATAGGGAAGNIGAPGSGGSPTSTYQGFGIAGCHGGIATHAFTGLEGSGGYGGSSSLGGGGQGGDGHDTNGGPGQTHSGGGGGGAGSHPSATAGGGGGAGAYVYAILTDADLTGTLAWSIGSGGAAGTGSNANGGAGASGVINTQENFQ